MTYEISMPYYEGPMDLLLDLVSKKKIDITEISISELADSYMEKLGTFQSMDMELTSDFIYMASRLLEIKSRYMLYLSLEEETEDPRAEIFEALEEYAKYKKISLFFLARHEEAPNRYFRWSPEVYVEEVIDFSKVRLADVVKAFPKKLPKERVAAPKAFMKKIISVEEKAEKIHDLLLLKQRVYFEETLEKKQTDEQVASLLGVLELVRGKRARVHQREHLERILIEKGAVADGAVEPF